MRRWHLWLLWLLLLAACPVGLLAVSLSYPDVAPYPPPWPPNPPPLRWAENLLTAHAWLSLFAVFAASVLADSLLEMLAAWAGVAVWLGMTALFSLSIVLGKTGMYF